MHFTELGTEIQRWVTKPEFKPAFSWYSILCPVFKKERVLIERKIMRPLDKHNLILVKRVGAVQGHLSYWTAKNQQKERPVDRGPQAHAILVVKQRASPISIICFLKTHHYSKSYQVLMRKWWRVRSGWDFQVSGPCRFITLIKILKAAKVWPRQIYCVRETECREQWRNTQTSTVAMKNVQSIQLVSAWGLAVLLKFMSWFGS